MKHVVVADSIGVMLNASERKTSNVVVAFTLGVASHAVMDTVEPDYTVNWFGATQWGVTAPFLLFQAGGTIFVLRSVFAESRGNRRELSLRMAAIAGGIIPDIIDGVYSVLNPHAWYAGKLLLPWHNLTWQVNPMSIWATSALTLVVLAIRYLSGYALELLQGIGATLRAKVGP